MPAPAIGMDRLPREVRELLEEAADNAARAAAELTRVFDRRSPSGLIAEIQGREEAGDRMTHDLAHALRSRRIGGRDRELLRSVAEAIDDLVDAIDASARIAAGCDCGRRARLASEILRDMARADAHAVRMMDEGASEWMDQVAAVRSLRKDGERHVRLALAESLRPGADPLRAIAQRNCLEQLAGALAAAGRIAGEAERTRVAARS